MLAYVLISVEQSEIDQIFRKLDDLVTLAESTKPGTDWQITAHIHKSEKSEIKRIHRQIRKIEGVKKTAIAFETSTAQTKRKQ